jgi:alpha-tubulin suppressor-like RCC1 family protein
MCWGSNSSGQLGDGTTTNRSTPVDVSGLPSGVSSLLAHFGYGHTCALLGSGRAMCWGLNSSGQLGTGSTSNSTTPVEVTGLAGAVSMLSVGYYFTCALLSTSGINCWGSNDSGQLGNGANEDVRTVPAAVSCP